MRIPIRRLDPGPPAPDRATRRRRRATTSTPRADVELEPRGGRALVPTGIAIAIPPGYAGFVQPRSGLALRHGVTVLNTPGLVDAGYRDEIRVMLVNLDPTERVQGEPRRPHRAARDPAVRDGRVGRGVDDLDDTDRGLGGWGSTG